MIQKIITYSFQEILAIVVMAVMFIVIPAVIYHYDAVPHIAVNTVGETK